MTTLVIRRHPEFFKASLILDLPPLLFSLYLFCQSLLLLEQTFWLCFCHSALVSNHCCLKHLFFCINFPVFLQVAVPCVPAQQISVLAEPNKKVSSEPTALWWLQLPLTEGISMGRIKICPTQLAGMMWSIRDAVVLLKELKIAPLPTLGHPWGFGVFLLEALKDGTTIPRSWPFQSRDNSAGCLLPVSLRWSSHKPQEVYFRASGQTVPQWDENWEVAFISII